MHDSLILAAPLLIGAGLAVMFTLTRVRESRDAKELRRLLKKCAEDEAMRADALR